MNKFQTAQSQGLMKKQVKQNQLKLKEKKSSSVEGQIVVVQKNSQEQKQSESPKKIVGEIELKVKNLRRVDSESESPSNQSDILRYIREDEKLKKQNSSESNSNTASWKNKRRIFSISDGPSVNQYCLIKEPRNCLNYLIDMFYCKEQNYSILEQYSIKVSYNFCVFLFSGQYKIQITHEKEKEIQQIENWEISYSNCNCKWQMNNTQSQINIIYQQPYFIVQDKNTTLNYRFKKPICFSDAELFDYNGKLVVQFIPINLIYIDLAEESQLKYLIPITVFIDQQNLNINI